MWFQDWTINQNPPKDDNETSKSFCVNKKTLIEAEHDPLNVVANSGYGYLVIWDLQISLTKPQAGNDKFTLGRLYQVGIFSFECYLSFLPLHKQFHMDIELLISNLKMNRHIMWHQVVYNSASIIILYMACTTFCSFQKEKMDGQVSDAQTAKDQQILALNI